jgi:hypothetical protein
VDSIHADVLVEVDGMVDVVLDVVLEDVVLEQQFVLLADLILVDVALM